MDERREEHNEKMNETYVGGTGVKKLTNSTLRDFGKRKRMEAGHAIV